MTGSFIRSHSKLWQVPSSWARIKISFWLRLGPAVKEAWARLGAFRIRVTDMSNTDMFRHVLVPWKYVSNYCASEGGTRLGKPFRAHVVVQNFLSFFVLCTVKDKILTIDNLKRQRMVYVNRYCMCLINGECPIVRELWYAVLYEGEFRRFFCNASGNGIGLEWIEEDGSFGGWFHCTWCGSFGERGIIDILMGLRWHGFTI